MSPLRKPLISSFTPLHKAYNRDIFHKKDFSEGTHYYILAEKNEIDINKDSLAYKLSNEDKTFGIVHYIYNGNFDFLLEKRTKSGEPKGIEFALKNDLEFEL